MSGHSKWSTIKHKKGKADALRGRLFTKLIREITVAAREGGGDVNINPRLRLAVQAGKDSNMPADNIDRAVKKGTGELPGVVYEAATYEGYGPAGVAFLIEVLTDNKNRTVSEVRHTFAKFGGSMAETGAVAWQFDSKGTLTVAKDDATEDDLMLAGLDAGLEDIDAEGEALEAICAPTDLESLKQALEEAEIPFADVQLTRVPQNTVAIAGGEAATLIRLLESLEENDDVQTVHANFDIDISELEAIAAEE